MKIEKKSVFFAMLGAVLCSFLFAAGPRPTAVALDLSIFTMKCSIVLAMLWTCMETEK